MRSKTAIACVTVSLLVGLAACGDDSDNGAPTTAAPSTVALSAADQEVADAVATVVAGPDVTGDEADCIGSTLVSTLGADRLRTLGWTDFAAQIDAAPTTPPPGDEEHRLIILALAMTMPYERADAEQTADAFAACAADWKVVVATGLSEGTDRMSTDSASCVADRMSDEYARTVFIEELDRADPTLSYLDELMGYYDDCLTPSERDALDFN